MKKHEVLTVQMLLHLGFTRINGSDLNWDHLHLQPKNLWLCDFDGLYHFMVRGNTYQGIGQMKTLNDMEIGFKFVTGTDIYDTLK